MIDRLRRERLPVELAMMFLCCHASLSEQMQVAPTLQVLCGLEGRLESVLAALYLLFNEGYALTEDRAAWFQADLCHEAIYLARLLTTTRQPAVHALLARFLLQASRLPARLDPDTGEAVALPDQDRSRWDRRLIAEGLGHLEAAAPDDIVTLQSDTTSSPVALIGRLAYQSRDRDRLPRWPRRRAGRASAHRTRAP